MARPARIQLPGACYLVTLAGNNRQDIFLSNQDRRHFLGLLRAQRERFGLKVYAYCLLNNSAHLVLETSGPDLSRVMQGFNTTYTKHFNGQHNTVGHVFQGRFKSCLVDKERWLLELTCYVHLAPLREGLKVRPWRYLWSSCAAYVESELREPMVDTAPVLRLFAKNRLKQSVRYLQYIKSRMASGGAPGFPVHGHVIGDAEFAARAAGAGPRQAGGEPAGRERARRMVAEAVAKGVDEERLLGRGRWRRVSAVRRELIHRLWKEAGLGVSEIARMFHRTPSAVSQLVKSVEAPEAKIR